MRIAFSSFEFPPDTGGGGIGTYLAQVTRMLAERGHDVEVFAGSNRESVSSRLPSGVQLHRIAAAGSHAFRSAVVQPFLAVHRTQPFDVIEGTDFDASALEIKRALPGLPYVVKLHTPRFVVDELHHRAPGFGQKLRMSLGALRKGEVLHHTPIRQQADAQIEIAALQLADRIAAPSAAIAQSARTWTVLSPDKISVFPYPYIPAPELLAIPAATDSNRVTFLGRLEERKGVIDLTDAIPAVRARHPAARFRFVGHPMIHAASGERMDTFLLGRLGAQAEAVEFTGPCAPRDISRLLAETDILVAPSHWESFGLVCCEGLAAARAVIGSSNGGMAEILDQGACGLLVPPHKPGKLAEAILRLLMHPDERRRLGEAGRRRIIDQYSSQRVLPAQLDCYESAMNACRKATAT